MTQATFGFFAVFSMLLGSSLSSLFAQTSRKGEDYAFLVGCSTDKANRLRELPHTMHDLEDFKQALIATGLAPDHIRLFHNLREKQYLPEKSKILNELKILLTTAKPEDSVILAFTGHAIHFKGDKTGFFCPIDADIDDRKSLIPMTGEDGLLDLLKGCKSRKKLLIVDACRNDPFAISAQGIKKEQFDDQDNEEIPAGVVAFYSCGAGQKSHFDPERETWYLLSPSR